MLGWIPANSPPRSTLVLQNVLRLHDDANGVEFFRWDENNTPEDIKQSELFLYFSSTTVTPLSPSP